MRGSAARGTVDVPDLDPNDAADVAAAALVGRDHEAERSSLAAQRLPVFLEGEQDRRVAELRIKLAPGDNGLVPIRRGEDDGSGTQRAGSLDDCAIRTEIMRVTPLASRPSVGSPGGLPATW